MDETGAVVPGARITLVGPSGASKVVSSGSDGSYSIAGLVPGSYTVRAEAPDLTQTQPLKIVLTSGGQTLNVQMKVASVTQQVTVQENGGPSVTTEPANNATAMVLRGEDLQTLSDDPDDLQSDLQALAGPSADPEGGEIYNAGSAGARLFQRQAARKWDEASTPKTTTSSRITPPWLRDCTRGSLACACAAAGDGACHLD